VFTTTDGSMGGPHSGIWDLGRVHSDSHQLWSFASCTFLSAHDGSVFRKLKSYEKRSQKCAKSSIIHIIRAVLDCVDIRHVGAICVPGSREVVKIHLLSNPRWRTARTSLESA